MKAKSLDEAMEIFLTTRPEYVICINNGKERACRSYEDAMKFFNLKQ